MTLVSVLLLVRNGSHQLEMSPRNILHLRPQSPGSGGTSPNAAPQRLSVPPLPPLPLAVCPPRSLPIKRGTSCHRGWRLTHLYSHGLDAVQDLLLVPSQSHPYSQEVSGRHTDRQRNINGQLRVGVSLLPSLSEVRDVSSAGPCLSAEQTQSPSTAL